MTKERKLKKMRSLNKVMLIGNIGNDLELKGENGKEYIRFSLATADNLDKDAAPEWHRIVAFKGHAANIAKHLKKGSHVFIEGRLQTSKYQKNGQTFYNTEIIVQDVIFL